MNRLALLTSFLVASVACAGTLENFAPCAKTNDCRSLRCSDGKCRPSGQYIGRGPLGGECDTDANCLSKNCHSRRCEAPNPAKGGSKPSPTGRSRGQDDDSAPAERAEPAPVADDKNDPVTLDACGRDLRATVYAKTTGPFVDHYARDACAQFSPQVIAKAKALFLGGYGANFKLTCEAIEGHSDEEIECSRKLRAQVHPEDVDGEQFVIPEPCLAGDASGAADACIKDLIATVLAGLSPKRQQMDAKRVCGKYSAETIAKAKAVMAAGYGGDLYAVSREVDGRDAEEIDCSKRYWDTKFGAEKSPHNFNMQDDCKKHH